MKKISILLVLAEAFTVCTPSYAYASERRPCWEFPRMRKVAVVVPVAAVLVMSESALGFGPSCSYDLSHEDGRLLRRFSTNECNFLNTVSPNDLTSSLLFFPRRDDDFVFASKDSNGESQSFREC